MGIMFVFTAVIVISCLMITAFGMKGRRQEDALLQQEINAKRTELAALDQQILVKKEELKALQVDSRTMTSEAVNNVLNKYDYMNIRVPKDIIEDVTYYGFTDEKQIFEYIESQRQHWKLENNKKMNLKAGA